MPVCAWNGQGTDLPWLGHLMLASLTGYIYLWLTLLAPIVRVVPVARSTMDVQREWLLVSTRHARTGILATCPCRGTTRPSGGTPDGLHACHDIRASGTT